MSMEIGGVPSGAQNMHELFETEYDEFMGRSWMLDLSQDVEVDLQVADNGSPQVLENPAQPTAEARCECCGLVVCDPLYRYV